MCKRRNLLEAFGRNIKSARNSDSYKFGNRSSQLSWAQLVLVQVKSNSVKNTYWIKTCWYFYNPYFVFDKLGQLGIIDVFFQIKGLFGHPVWATFFFLFLNTLVVGPMLKFLFSMWV